MTTAPTGYRIRPGHPQDVEDLATINAAVHLQSDTGGTPHPGIGAWTRDLFDGHPTVTPAAFLVAEELGSDRPVASLVAVAQLWRHGEVRLPVVQVELVGTDPAHRGNRLTDRMFAALHEQCAQDGTVLQAIEGIPYFYRRFGYEYALASGGAPLIPAAALPAATAGPGAASHIGAGAALYARPAGPHDTGALAAVDRSLGAQAGLFCPRDEAMWRHEIAGRQDGSLVCRTVVALVDETGTIVGHLVHSMRPNPAGELAVFSAACADPGDWPAAVPVVLAYLAGAGARTASESGRPFTAVRPLLDAAHPLSRLAPPGVPQRSRDWYVRTGDPVGLLEHLRPALAARWRAAGLRWPHETLLIDAYHDVARLDFDRGELVKVSPGRRGPAPGSDPAVHLTIPPGALLQLALGYRTLPEVRHGWPDCIVRDATTALFVETGFPRVPAMVWPVL
jgi:ribosomal protein S18 acetylase RimI-like enzyme